MNSLEAQIAELKNTLATLEKEQERLEKEMGVTKKKSTGKKSKGKKLVVKYQGSSTFHIPKDIDLNGPEVKDWEVSCNILDITMKDGSVKTIFAKELDVENCWSTPHSMEIV